MSNKLYFLIITLLAALLVACNTPAEQPAPAEETETTTETTETSDTETEEAAPEAEAETGDRTTIKVMLVDYIPDVTDVWLEEEVVPAFQEEHPNVDVEFVYVNWGTLDETVQGYFAAESGADIINLGSEYVAEYGDRLAPLNAEMEAWGQLDNFVPASLDTVTWQGEVRGLPWLTAPRAVMCRTDILEELGFDGAPTTFDEMIAVAEAGTIIEDNALVRQGFMADGLLNNWQEYLNIMNSLGAPLYKADGTPNFDSPEAKAALEFMNARRAAIMPNDTIAGLPEASGSRLATGEVVCRWGNLWGAPATDDPLWEDISLSAGFTDGSGQPTVQVFNDWLAIPDYSENKAEAVAFLQFLGSAENLNAYNEQFGSFPPRTDGWTGYVDNPIMQEMGRLMDEYGVGFADVRETAQLRDILVAEIDAYFSGLQDVDTALANIQDNYTAVLDDAGRLGEPPAQSSNDFGSDEAAESTDTTDAPEASGAAVLLNEGEPVTIKVMLVDYIPDVTDVWLEDEVVPAFQEMHPNVDVEFVYVNWGTLDETVQGYFAAESGADIINLGSEYVAEYGDRLAPLNTQMAEWGELDQFVPATLDTVTWNGEVRGLPWLTAPRAVMCRTDILEEAGVVVPTTYEEALAQAAATTVIEDNSLVRQGFMADGLLNNWQEFINLVWSNGGTVYNEDGTPNLNSPEAKAALEFMNARRAAILPSDTIAGLPEASGSRLATGEVGCRWGNLWGAPPTDDPLWENISLSPGFVSEEFGTEPVAQVFNDWLAIPAYSENLDTAVAFLQFLGSAENLNAYNEQFGSFPPRQDAWFGYVDDPIMQEMGQIMSDYGVGFADIRETAQLRDILVAEIDAYFSGLQDVDTALDNINTQYEDVLRDAGRID